MAKPRFRSFWTLMGLLMLLPGLIVSQPGSAAQPDQTRPARVKPLAPDFASWIEPVFSAPLAPASSLTPLVVQADRWDTSPDLRSLAEMQAVAELSTQPTAEPSTEPSLELFSPTLPKALPKEPTSEKEPAETAEDDAFETVNPASILSPASMPAPILNFEGVNNRFGGWPPDTQGDIGPSHYIQWINLHFAIWEIDKVQQTATLVYGPLAGNTLFAGFGGPCQTTNNGDPITLYDSFADRWMMSQMALPYYPNGPFYQCVAVSASNNPTGAWHRYQYEIPLNKMNDYAKLGVWPNAYFMTVNQFAGGSMGWAGVGAAAMERQAMVDGLPAHMVYFDLANVNIDYGGMLPADFDGQTPPPEGAPGYFAEWDDSAWIGPQDAVRLWEFQVDWQHPENAAFGLNGQPNWIIPTRDVDPNMCNQSRDCIPQPGTTRKVDAIADRLMYRLQYRNFGGYATLISNHTVDYNSTDRAGIHWFELRKGALESDWSLFQDGVFSPDATHRWMGSLAMDHVGNIALGYSVSSSTVYPSVRYSGRLAGDPLGTMPQGEVELVAGSGSQTGSSRWGDYSTMSLDPTDDCTFWYTQQYVKTTGSNSWTTRIGSFRFPGCSVGAQGSLRGRVTDNTTNAPLIGAQVTATLSPAQTLTTHTNNNGDYLIVAPTGVYTVIASNFGFVPQTVTNVIISENNETIQDFALNPAAKHTLSGVVRDASSGVPLYAQIIPQVGGASPVWSDPLSGAYSLEMPEGFPFDLEVKAFPIGYLTRVVQVAAMSGDTHLDIDLQIDEKACKAPGYQPVHTSLYFSDFETDNGGLTTTTISGANSWAWGVVNSGPNEAASGIKAWATNLNGNYSDNENSTLNLPPIDLSGYSGQMPFLLWKQFLVTEARYDFASIEVSAQGIGGPWTTVYGPVSGNVDTWWTTHALMLDPSFAVSNLLIRFHFTSDVSVNFPGWYIDDVSVGVGGCLPIQGGFVSGFVKDGNTLTGLVDSRISSDFGANTTSLATPNDEGISDGFYQLFTPTGTHVFTATFGLFYQPAVESVAVVNGQNTRQDFLLQAPMLEYDPHLMDVTLELGQTLTRTLTLTNAGGAKLDYQLLELSGGFVPQGQLEQPEAVVKPHKGELPDAHTLGLPAAPAAPPTAGGQALASWTPANLAGPWGVGYDPLDESVWVSSPAVSWGGVDRLAEYSTDGVATGRTFAHAPPHTTGPADMAYNWNTGKFWIMNVNTGINNCIHEFDPQLGYTGAQICPETSLGFTNSQRGLAYDPTTDTWFAGSWNDLMVYRFDSDGNILESVNTGLAVAGLAYNPDSGHLFVMTNASTTYVYVLDVANGYASLGRFSISEGFTAFAGAGIEFDCDGNLWGVDLNLDKVVKFGSGESANLCQRDIPWVSSQPSSGEVTVGASEPVTITFDARKPAVDQPGVYSGQLKFKENTPYSVDNLPITMTVTAPASFGLLKGMVTGKGYCDSNPASLSGALVEIESSLGVTETTTTDTGGVYQRWLDEISSPYTLTLTASGYASLTGGIIISAGMTTTLDLDLPLLEPCVKTNPTALEPTLKFGKTLTQTVTLQNVGHRDTPYTWHESQQGAPLTFTNLDFVSVAPLSGDLIAQDDPISATVTFTASAPTVTAPGIYYGNLALESEDPLNDQLALPISMTVLPLEYGVAIATDTPVVQGIAGETLSVSFVITNTSEGPTDSFMLSRSAPRWSPTLSQNLVGPLLTGANDTVDLKVTLPDTVLPGDSQVFTVTASSQADGTKIDAASVTIQVIQPLADLELGVSVSPDPHWVSQPLTYTVTITNHGTTSAPNVVFTNVLSPRLQYLRDSAGDGGASGCSLASGVLSCQLGWLEMGSVRSFFIRLIPVRPGLGVSQAVVASQAPDPDLSNNIVSLVEGYLGWLYYLPVVGVK